jgi:transposase-like protein
MCPVCKAKGRITTRKGGYDRCNACKLDLTVRTGTVFERSHVPLHKWLYAMYLLVTARKGISSLQLGKEIGIAQKSAWFVLQRLREACSDDLGKLSGVVEVDETFISGPEANRHFSNRRNLASGHMGKIVVIGLRERDGKRRTKAFHAIKRQSHQLRKKAITENVQKGSTIHPDENIGYQNITKFDYKQASVNHFMYQSPATDPTAQGRLDHRIHTTKNDEQY